MDSGPQAAHCKQRRECDIREQAIGHGFILKIFLVSAPLEFPLAVYCLAAQLSATPDTADCAIEILNLDASRLNQYSRKNAEIWRYLAQLEAARPDLVAFSVYLWSHLCIRELIAITHQLYPKTAIVVGGPELATPEAAATFLASGEVTAAIRGEGEITMVELARRLRAGDGPAGVAGCSWYNDGMVVHEPPRPPVRDLSLLASAFLTGWVSDDLFDRLAPAHKGAFPRAFVETYRGCYMQCSYCQWGNGTKERFEFPQERVRAELSWILSRRVSVLWIVDAMFGYKKQTAKDILRYIIEEKRYHGARTSIVCYHNQDFFDPELFDLYREAGVSVEVDLQSTDREVLTRVGREKWYIDSYDRHLEAFRDHRVPTTGAADLIVGLPHDHLSSFAESVDFLLRRGMSVNLYQTSMIPDTPMLRSVAEDGTVLSSLPPRAVFKNRTFPVREMVAAWLIGHGVNFFRRYPCTARLLWRQGFARPVDLCQRIGDLVWERYHLMYGESHTQDAVPAEEQELVGSLLDELCIQEWLRPVVRDLFRLEAAVSRWAMLGKHVATPPVADVIGLGAGEAWLAARPRYRREGVEEIRLEHRVDRALHAWDPAGEIPGEEFWRGLAGERDPMIALVHQQSPGWSRFSLVDEEVTYQLLLRFSGFFSVAECLENFACNWRQMELAPLREMLSSLVVAGIIDPGPIAPRNDAAVEGTVQPADSPSVPLAASCPDTIRTCATLPQEAEGLART
jgi:hypothetical protein